MNILKSYAKGFGLTLLAATSFSLVAPAAFAQGQSAPAAVQSVSIPDNLLGAVKLPALPKLAEKLIIISRKAELDAQSQMFLMMGLSQIGFPEFPGVAKDGHVTVFVLSGDDAEGSSVQFVTFAKLTTDSPVRQVLQGYGLTIEDRDGWALISFDPAAFAAVKDFAGLTAIASSASHFDLEARGYSSKSIKDVLNSAVESSLADGEADPKDAELVRSWVHLGLQLIDRIEWIGTGLSVDEEFLTIGSVLAPKAGTPEAAWINTPVAGGKVTAGQFLSADVAVGYVSKFDVTATEVYVKSLAELVKQIPNQDAAKIVQQGLDAYLGIISPADGSVATVVTGMNLATNKSKTQTIGTGKYELAQIDSFYNELFNTLLPSAIALFGDEVAGEFKKHLQTELKTDVAKIGSQSVNALVVTTPDPQDEAKSVSQETLYTVIKGAFISADSLESLKAVADSYSAGQPVANNLADAYPLAANSWTNGALNVQAFATSLAEFGETVEGGEATAMFKAFSKIDAKPITFGAKNEGGHAVYSMSVSLGDVIKLIRAGMEFQQQQAVEEVEITEVQVVPAN